jgi:glycine cleavage system aminomethyltransferase T
MPGTVSLIARGPLLELHRTAGATLETAEGWQIATKYPKEPDRQSNALVDLSHWSTYEINGPETEADVISLCGVDVPPRTIHVHKTRHVYRLSLSRAIIFGDPIAGTYDVTGGWASLALFGPDCQTILNKVTAVDLREKTLPIRGCCQGPIFGVITLFGRYPDHMMLHISPDSAQFIWELLMDSGQEFNLRPVGAGFYVG